MLKVGDKVKVTQKTIWAVGFRGHVGKVVFVSDLGGLAKVRFEGMGKRGKVLFKSHELEKVEG